MHPRGVRICRVPLGGYSSPVMLRVLMWPVEVYRGGRAVAMSVLTCSVPTLDGVDATVDVCSVAGATVG
jgi:hypothetical protein